MAVSSESSALPSDASGVAIRGGAIRVAGYGAGMLVSLGTATILVRHLGIPSFGRYVTVTSLIALVAGVTEAGILLYGIREWGARAEPDRRRLLANLLGMRLILTAGGLACVECFALIAGYREVLVLGALVAGAGLLIQVIIDVLSISLQAQLQLGRFTAVELTRRVLALLIIGALALLDASMLPFFVASTVAGAVALAVLAWIVRSSIAIRLSFDWQVWRELLAETLPFAIALSIGAIYFYVTVIIMSLIATPRQTGLFATSFRVTQVLLAIPGLLLTAVFPLMTQNLRGDGIRGEKERRARGEMVGKTFTVSIICGVWMSLAIGLGAPFLIDVIGGSQARGAVSVLRIQGLVLTLSFVSVSNAFNLVALRRYRSLAIASGCALAFNILLAVALVSILGAKGGALADVIAELMLAIALTVVLMHAVPRYQIRVSLVRSVLLAAALAVIVLLAPVGSLVRVIGATFIYFGVLRLMGAIPDEVLNVARRLPPLRTPS